MLCLIVTEHSHHVVFDSAKNCIRVMFDSDRKTVVVLCLVVAEKQSKCCV